LVNYSDKAWVTDICRTDSSASELFFSRLSLLHWARTVSSSALCSAMIVSRSSSWHRICSASSLLRDARSFWILSSQHWSSLWVSTAIHWTFTTLVIHLCLPMWSNRGVYTSAQNDDNNLLWCKLHGIGKGPSKTFSLPDFPYFPLSTISLKSDRQPPESQLLEENQMMRQK